MISSTGGAAKHQGGSLGQFEYDEDRGYYIQSSTEQRNVHVQFRPRYLYHTEEEEWCVSDIPGERRGWLYNPGPSKTPPTSGWQYADPDTTSKVPWQDDPTLTVTPAPLPSQFMVTASGAAAEKWPSYLGIFTRTQRWWNGRSVYINAEGRLLYFSDVDDDWAIGDKLGWRALRGSRAHHSPVDENRWRYAAEPEDKPASVTVTGSD